MPNYIKIAEKVAEIWRLTVFKMAAVRHMDFLKFKLFNGLGG